jgi:hypothetical protein
MAVQVVKNIELTAYETCVAAAFKPVNDILLIRVESLELTLSRLCPV